MTLKQAGELYNLQTEKIENAKKHIHMIGHIVNENQKIQRPIASVRTDILLDIAEDLIDYVNHLEAVLDEEVEIK